MTLATVIVAAAAATMLIAFLIKRPSLNGAVKIWLFFAIGALPIAAAMVGNVAGYERTKQRGFCAGCHEMVGHTSDAADRASTTLAAMHSRNTAFGGESCYECHRDYGLFGAVTTKMDGMKHMWAHYTRDPKAPLHLYKPFPNSNCMQCHSTTLPGWKDEPEHQAVMDDIASGKTGCASKGCHGPVHPAMKEGK